MDPWAWLVQEDRNQEGTLVGDPGPLQRAGGGRSCRYGGVLQGQLRPSFWHHRPGLHVTPTSDLSRLTASSQLDDKDRNGQAGVRAESSKAARQVEPILRAHLQHAQDGDKCLTPGPPQKRWVSLVSTPDPCPPMSGRRQALLPAYLLSRRFGFSSDPRQLLSGLLLAV